MDWPDDYWPERGRKATRKEWDETIARFGKDHDELERMVKNPKTDLYSRIPWRWSEESLGRSCWSLTTTLITWASLR